MPISSWSTTPATNATADSASGIIWSEGMAPAQVNDSSRAVMAVIKGDWDTLGFDSLNSAWTSGGATATPQTGAFGSASGTRRYKKLGKIVFIEFSITVTTVGTASGWINLTLPHASAGNFVLAGKENALSGAALTGFMTTSGTTVAVTKYDGTFPTASGGNVVVSGVYETTA